MLLVLWVVVGVDCYWVWVLFSCCFACLRVVVGYFCSLVVFCLFDFVVYVFRLLCCLLHGVLLGVFLCWRAVLGYMLFNLINLMSLRFELLLWGLYGLISVFALC